jgi:uncharacterized membrane protein YdjX (TVP38/TMEM64 family)
LSQSQIRRGARPHGERHHHQRSPGAERSSLAWLRLGAFLVALLLFILIPFALWGGALDREAPALLADLQRDAARPYLALLGGALLVADVVAPVPSSLVAMALCWELGPLAGGCTVALGTWLAFVTGYGLGRALPEERLRRWIGAALWIRLRRSASWGSLAWIVATRPLPLLAEATALLAGALRLPVVPALTHAALASSAVGALYAGSAALGRAQPGAALTALALFAVPALGWLAHRVAVRRLLAPASAAPSTSHVQEEES